MPPTRVHRVDDRVVVPIAAMGGIVAALGPSEPTGSAWADAVLVSLAVGIVVWAGATARWWTLVLLAMVATAISGSLILAGVGVLAAVAAVWIGTQRLDLAMARAVVVAVSLNVAIRSEIGGFLGLSMLLTVGASIIVVLSGVRRRSGRVRRGALIVVGSISAFVVVAIVGGAAAALSASGDLRDADRWAREGISMLGDGEYVDAADRFDQAASALSSSNSELARPWAKPAGWLPVVAQHRSAVVELSDSAASASADLAAALRVVDPEQLRLVGGRFDLDAIRLIEQPFVVVQESIGELRDAIDRIGSPWLVAGVADRLHDFDTELTDNEGRIESAVDVVRLAPQLLGADETRRYFIAFTTPAEARGMGGFMGNWAVLTATDGRLRLAEFGRTRELNFGGTPPRFVTAPADWLDQWGRFGFTDGPDESTSSTPWSNVTMSPVFPSTAQVIEELLPQSGGPEVDGVIAMTPQVLRGLLSMTGPISVDGADVRLDESNVLQFLLIDQYEIDDNSSRIDLLEVVSRATVQLVLDGGLPNPTVVARELGPAVATGDLVAWSVDPDEQTLFESVGLASSLPALDGGDGIAAVFNNAGGNKIDAYLGRDLTYTAVVDERTGAVSATMELVLTNTADVPGLPDSVVDNSTGDRRGTNRTLLSLYSALPMKAVTVDGRTISMRTSEEAGWRVNSAFLGIPPGGSITVRAEYVGELDLPLGYTLAVRPQPLVLPERHAIDVASANGDILIERSGVAERPEVIVADEASPPD